MIKLIPKSLPQDKIDTSEWEALFTPEDVTYDPYNDIYRYNGDSYSFNGTGLNTKDQTIYNWVKSGSPYLDYDFRAVGDSWDKAYKKWQEQRQAAIDKKRIDDELIDIYSESGTDADLKHKMDIIEDRMNNGYATDEEIREYKDFYDPNWQVRESNMQQANDQIKLNNAVQGKLYPTLTENNFDINNYHYNNDTGKVEYTPQTYKGTNGAADYLGLAPLAIPLAATAPYWAPALSVPSLTTVGNFAADAGLGMAAGYGIDKGAEVLGYEGWGDLASRGLQYLPGELGLMMGNEENAQWTNPGYYLGGAALQPLYNMGKYSAKRGTWYAPAEYVVAHTAPGKRAIELAMRSTALADPIPAIKLALSNKQQRNGAIQYILTGNKKGKDKFIEGSLYDGNDFPVEGVDWIDAYLYGTPLPFMRSLDAGIHSSYISKNYPDKNIPIYELGPGRYTTPVLESVTPTGEVEGINTSIPYSSQNGLFGKLDAAGHLLEKGVTPSGKNVYRHLDIWKFNPEDYRKKYTLRKSKLVDFGLNTVNEAGTPIIARSPWEEEFVPLMETDFSSAVDTSTPVIKISEENKKIFDELLKNTFVAPIE